MVALSLLFAAYVIVSWWYIRKLHKQIQSHGADWHRIEQLTDHNKDGEVVLHIKHT